MGVTLHPSQKRSSCEACRKHKLRCKREEPNNGRCTRCARLNLECVLGQQKKVGRPRRTQAEPTTHIDDGAHGAPIELPDFDLTEASSLNLGPDYGAFDAALSTPNLEAFFMNAPGDGMISARRPSLVEFPFGLPGDGSLPWDTMNSDPFQSTSSGSSTAWTSPPSTTASSPAECVVPVLQLSRPPGPSDPPIGAADAMANLSKINLDLHARMTIIERAGDTIDFLSIVCTTGVLFIDNTTFIEFMVNTTQEFVRTLGRLRARNRDSASPPAAKRACHNYGLLAPFAQQSAVEPSSLMLSPYESAASRPTTSSQSELHQVVKMELLPPPISLLVTSVFVQLICLFEVMLHQVRRRMTDPARGPLPGMQPVSVAGIVLRDSCSCGIVFAELTMTLLERMERLLGTDPSAFDEEAGLLSQGQKETLWRELGGIAGPDLGMTRASNVRKGLDAAKKAFVEAAMSQ